MLYCTRAGGSSSVAERLLAKEEVASSTLVFRSKFPSQPGASRKSVVNRAGRLFGPNSILAMLRTRRNAGLPLSARRARRRRLAEVGDMYMFIERALPELLERWETEKRGNLP
jgi:hypothetical protein